MPSCRKTHQWRHHDRDPAHHRRLARHRRGHRPPRRGQGLHGRDQLPRGARPGRGARSRDRAGRRSRPGGPGRRRVRRADRGDVPQGRRAGSAGSPGQQRGRHPYLQGRRVRAGLPRAVARDQRDRHDAVLPRGRAPHVDPPGRQGRRHRQRLVDGRGDRRPRGTRGLCREQGCCRQLHDRPRPRGRARGHPGQRAAAWHDHDRHDRCGAPRPGAARAGRLHHRDEPLRRARGDGAPDPLAAVRRSLVHLGRAARRLGRRLHGG